MLSHKKAPISKYTLNNGMTVLVYPSLTIPKVSTQLWYYVGSKDEQSGEKGLAHLLEHMIFKGTKTLSESDINEITHKLSGSCNAFTSYDYTGYLFDFPSQNWQEALSLLADCMRNCTFKQEHLNSELKAVIQELKMYKDSYGSALIEAMISAIFPDHPYHHPIIGYKQDLWSLDRERMVHFYEKHYVPNNATLVVVGDVQPDEVAKLAKHYFESIPADKSYKRKEYYHSTDLIAQQVTLYRDVQQSVGIIAFVVPGSKDKKEFYFEVLTWILASGKSSRLYQLLVDEKQLATDVDAFLYDLFDYGLFIIEFEPKHTKDIDAIISLIYEEITKLTQQGISDTELRRGIKKSEADFFNVLESNQKCAYLIGKFYLATGNEQFLFEFVNDNAQQVGKEIQQLVTDYLRPSVAHTGKLLPISASDKTYWTRVQELSDQEDARVLSGKVRETIVEEAIQALKVTPRKPKNFNYPQYQKFTLKNGLDVYYYANNKVPKIELIIEFKAKNYYDPEQLIGLNTFMSALLVEGTKNYSGTELAQEIESYGMTLTTTAGYISLSVLTKDLEKGLSLLTEILTESLFEEEAVEKVREIMIADIRSHWDTPSEFAGDVVRSLIYKGHPYSKSRLGTLEAVKKITRKDLLDCYKAFTTPQGSRMAIVGDFNNYDLNKVLESTLGAWQGPQAPTISFPALKPVEYTEIKYPINRDQVVLVFAGLSVDRNNPDYDKLLVFDQIFGGGVLGSMSSRLFQLREQTGLFYTIGGSTIAQADEQPGMVYVKTIVSLDRLKEAEKAIKETIEHVIDTLTPEEFEAARNAIINSMVDNFETDRSIAATFLTLARYKLSADYFNTRAQDFEKITLDQVKTAAHKVLDTKKLAIFKIGRV